MKRDDIFRALSLAAAFAAVLSAGSCASPVNNGLVTADPDHNHPIAVAPTYRSLKLSFATPAAGLIPQDETRFDGFVGSYLARGNGAISISVPKGPGASEAIRYFGERLAKMGVPRSSILVGTRTLVDGDPRVELGYIGYQATTDRCGDWSANLANTASNLPAPNFGCANQHNLAAMVADPRDLVAPRSMSPSDATRRSTVMDNYEKGTPTAATKTSDQSGAVSSQ